MAASDYGYYRSDGIQNSGTALRQNGNAYIYNSAGQIYPRQITESFTAGSLSDGYTCYTCRSGYNGDRHKQTWRNDKAYQGYYKGSEGSSMQSCGFFFPNSGSKMSVGSGNIIGFTVTHVKIQMNRAGGGYQSSTIEGHLRQGNLINSYKDGVFNRARYSDISLNSAEYVFSWLGQGNTTILEDRGGALCSFIQTFLNDSNMNSLCLHNTENNVGSSGEWSNNYGSCTSFQILVEGTRTVQL